MDEADICVGDVHAVGDALLQVCQPRQPCFKFAVRFANNRLPRAMVRNGRSGWYYRVLRTGAVSAGTRSGWNGGPIRASRSPAWLRWSTTAMPRSGNGCKWRICLAWRGNGR